MRKHKIFNEVYKDLNKVWFTASIPQYGEYYIGSGSLISGKVPFLRFFTRTIEDYQGLTMINYPEVLNYALDHIAKNGDTFEEDADAYDNLDMDFVKRDSLYKLATTLISMADNVIKGLPDESKDIDLIKTNLSNALAEIEVVSNPIERLSDIADSLIKDSGYTVLWVDSAIRTRNITLVKQGDYNTFVLMELKEFIPRDSRKNCSFISMSTTTVDHNVAKAIKGGTK